MGYFIDFSLFIYDCIYINNEKCKFTYISDSKDYKNIISDFLKKIVKMSINNKFIDDLLTDNKVKEENNFHDIQFIQREKIAHILSQKNNDKDWLQQNIIDCYNIFQIKINNYEKRKLFFILDLKNKIVKPLFLDINHLIHLNKKKEKNNKYKICLVCDKLCTSNP